MAPKASGKGQETNILAGSELTAVKIGVWTALGDTGVEIMIDPRGVSMVTPVRFRKVK